MSADAASPEPRRIPRRTIAAGVAWAAPAVSIAVIAPTAAASGVETTTTTPAPCVAKIENASALWVVGGADWDTKDMHGCTCGTHKDLRLKFTISQACDATVVKIRVRPIDGKATWCRFNTPGNEVWLEKTATKSGGVWTYPPQGLFANPTENANDGLYFPASGDNLGDCTGERKNQTGGDNDNDGMHLNPCVSGPYVEYQINLGAGYLPTTYTWGTNEGRLPGTCEPPPPAPVLKLVSSSCRNTDGTDPRVATVSWTGTANRIQRSTSSTFANNVTTTSVTGNSYTYPAFQVSSCATPVYFRVYQNNTTNYSNVVNVNG